MSKTIIGKRLKDTREYLGFSIAYVVDRTGFDTETIVTIENGERDIREEDLKLFSAVYKYPVDYFLGDEIESSVGIQILARAKKVLNDQDKIQILRFSQFLKYYGDSKRGGVR